MKSAFVKQQEQFLLEYKTLEQSIRQHTGNNVPHYEDSLNRSSEAEKLQICRIIRNYMVHREDSSKFLSFPQMTQFLHQENLKFSSYHAYVDDVAKKVNPITITTTLKQASNMLGQPKTNYLPILDNQNKIIGILTPSMLIRFISKASKMTNKIGPYLTPKILKQSLQDVEICPRQTRLDSYAPNTNIVIVNKTGTYWKCVDWTKLDKKK